MPRRREAARDFGFAPSLSHLKIELQGELNQSRIARIQDLSEGRVREVAVWIDELSPIEGVENVRTELEVLCFRDRDALRERDIPLILSRTATNGARRRGESTQSWICILAGGQIVPALHTVDRLNQL